MSAVRTICFFLDYQIKSKLAAENEIAQVLAKCINHNSTEIKHLAVQSVQFLTTSTTGTLDEALLKCFIPMLVNGTRERAPLVRTSSEVALASLIRLNKPDSIYKVNFNSINLNKTKNENANLKFGVKLLM